MSRILLGLTVALALAMTGCSSSLAKLDGKVTSAGTAVAGAEVLVTQESSGKGSLYGMTKEDGSLVFDWGGRSGLSPGKYKIVITRYENAGGQALPSGEEGQVLKQSGQAQRKQFEWHRELAAGKNTLILVLEEAKEVDDSAGSPTISH